MHKFLQSQQSRRVKVDYGLEPDGIKRLVVPVFGHCGQQRETKAECARDIEFGDASNPRLSLRNGLIHHGMECAKMCQDMPRFNMLHSCFPLPQISKSWHIYNHLPYLSGNVCPWIPWGVFRLTSGGSCEGIHRNSGVPRFVSSVVHLFVS